MRLIGSSQRLRRAFTLMEMMVVVLLIAVLTALIVPEMKGTFEDALLRSTSRKLLDAFALASSRAITLNQDCRVKLDLAEGRFVVERRVMVAGRESFVPLKDVDGSEGKLDKRIAIQFTPAAELTTGEDSQSTPAAPSEPLAGSATPDTAESETSVAFYADGTADLAEIQLRDRSGYLLKLRLNPVTARAWIIEPKPEAATP